MSWRSAMERPGAIIPRHAFDFRACRESGATAGAPFCCYTDACQATRAGVPGEGMRHGARGVGHEVRGQRRKAWGTRCEAQGAGARRGARGAGHEAWGARRGGRGAGRGGRGAGRGARDAQGLDANALHALPVDLYEPGVR